MTNTDKNWLQALSAFLDRRAIIMLFLGFSAGIPILLIFSSLSIWLGEAGTGKDVVTYFSWAALGYSFKFVWAPLVDEIPVPILGRLLGHRRSWLLIAQILIIIAISLMAMTDPASGTHALQYMAMAAVLLGFSSATQDIVIDAYRIELAEKEMQTVLASTYNAGYRIGMIVAGAGALFIAAWFGTAKGNYIYQAWQYTYLIMAVTMFIGIITTLIIPEPQHRKKNHHYHIQDYIRLVIVFACAVTTFILTFIGLNQVIAGHEDPLLAFLIETFRFICSGIVAIFMAYLLIQFGLVNKQMAAETWINPIADFFKRYGLKLSLALLLLIGFYRISDIIAGVISNVFYQDLNFTKEQIATAVKVYGVIFSLVGGFLGGLLSQRYNLMKMMFIGAVLASSTNLIFIALVKSGQTLAPVTVQIGQQQYQAVPDEIGTWSVEVPSQVLMKNQYISVKAAYQDQSQSSQQNLPYLTAQANKPVQIQLLPITHDQIVDKIEQQNEKILLEGQILGLTATQLKTNNQVQIQISQQTAVAKIDEQGKFSTIISGKDLSRNRNQNIIAQYQYNGQHITALQHYQLSDKAQHSILQQDIQPLPLINTTQEKYTLSGKVIKPYSTLWLYLAIIMDNLASGLAGAVFIAFLSSLTSVSFTAVQYAIFSSLMTLTPKILGGYSGTIVSKIGYPDFFLMTTLIGIPILFLIVWVYKLSIQHEQQNS